jgi:glycosyltransferase involved in cell wall biosynthesis
VSKTKIAFIGAKSFPSQAGVDRVVEAVTRGLAARGDYEITIYGDAEKVDRTQAPSNVNLISIPPLGSKYFRAFSQFLLAALHALFKRNYDLVHLHNLEAAYVLPFLRIKYPVVTTSHVVTHRRVDQWGRLSRFLIRLMEFPFIRLSNSCTAVSYVDTQYYVTKHKRPVEWIPNGIESTNPIPSATRREIVEKHGLKDKDYILFAAGRIIPTKGAHVLLAAAEKFASSHPHPIVIFGDLSRDPKYAKQLRDMAPDDTRFISFVESKSEVEAIIAGSKLLVFPSTVEGMSMVLLEAVTQKIHIIVSDIPENKSVLEENALYFRSEDMDDLAEKLVWALEHSEQMDKLTADSYQHVVENFSWGKIVSSYEECYTRVLHGQH